MKFWIAALCLATAWAQQPQEPLAQANTLLDAGRYKEAVDLLQPLAKANPNDFAVHFQLAFACSMAGQDEAAIAGFERVLVLKPDLLQARTNLGQLLINNRLFPRAIAVLEPALAQAPANPKLLNLMAVAATAAGDWSRAAPILTQLVELNPQDCDSWLRLAEAYQQLKQPARAAEIYARFPDSPAALERRGLLLLESGDLDGAISALERLRQTSPTPASLFALASAYLRAHQPLKAIPVTEQAVAAEPANFDLRLFAGRLFRDQKRYTEAGPHFLKAVNLRPNSGEAWNELTTVLILLKQYEPGLQALEKAKQLNGETPAYHYFRAMMLDAMGDAPAALTSYQRFLAATGDQNPDEAWKARQRIKVLERTAKK